VILGREFQREGAEMEKALELGPVRYGVYIYIHYRSKVWGH